METYVTVYIKCSISIDYTSSVENVSCLVG